MIRIDSVWLAVAPLDMRAGTEAALARVVGLLCLVGFSSALVAGTAIRGAENQIAEAVKWWRAHKPADLKDFPVVGDQGLFGWLHASLLVTALGLVWIALFIFAQRATRE